MISKRTHIFWIFISIILPLSGCAQKKQQKWTYKNTISLQEQAHPMSVVQNGGEIWVSAPAQKELLQINKQGKILARKTDLPRPMHITTGNGKIYVPLYLKDRLVTMQSSGFDTLALGATPDAPAGVAVKGDTIAVADFYHHRIILQIGNKTTTIGEKGHKKGQFFYPTDVELAHNKIYVADAYNNRVQVFSMKGKPLQVIGANEGIKVATGIAVYKNQLFVTDFYHKRILVYNLKGKLVQTLKEHFNKPTDISVINGDLYIPNYGGYSIVRYAEK